MRHLLPFFLFTLVYSCYSQLDTNDLDLHDVSNLLSDLDISEEDINTHRVVIPNENKPYYRRYSKNKKKKSQNNHFKYNERRFEHGTRRQKIKKHDRYEPEEIKNLQDPGISDSLDNFNRYSKFKSLKHHNSFSKSIENKYDYAKKAMSNNKLFRYRANEANIQNIDDDGSYEEVSNMNHQSIINQNRFMDQKLAIEQQRSLERQLALEKQKSIEYQKVLKEQHQQAAEQERILEEQRLLHQQQQKALQQNTRQLQRSLELQNQKLLQQHGQQQRRMIEEQKILAYHQQLARQQRLRQQQALEIQRHQAIQQQRLLIQRHNQMIQQQFRNQQQMGNMKQGFQKYSNYGY